VKKGGKENRQLKRRSPVKKAAEKKVAAKKAMRKNLPPRKKRGQKIDN